MTITINTATGAIIRTKKPRKTTTRKPRKGCAEKRVFPKYCEGMTTRAYIAAYHEANASVTLSTVDYLCN